MLTTVGNCMEDAMFGGQRVGAPKMIPASRAGVCIRFRISIFLIELIVLLQGMRLHSRGRKLRLSEPVGTVLPSDKLGDTVPQIESEEESVSTRSLDAPSRIVKKRFRAQQPSLSKSESRKPQMTHQSRIQQPRPGF